MADLRAALEDMHPDVEYRWAGDSADSDALSDYRNITDWDRNQTGMPLPDEAALIKHWQDMEARPAQPSKDDALARLKTVAETDPKIADLLVILGR